MKLNYFSMIPVVPNFVPPANVAVVRYGNPQIVGGVTQTTTTTTTNGVNASVNVGGVGVSVNISEPNTSITYTETTTTTTNGVQQQNTAGCTNARAMAQSNFNSALNSVKNQGFDETRLKSAKQIVSANCLSAAQVAQMCGTFAFEQSKLDFAKFAYTYCIDPGNYFKVNDVFEFSSSVDELSEYVSGR
jgi:hypothetical protein